MYCSCKRNLSRTHWCIFSLLSHLGIAPFVNLTFDLVFYCCWVFCWYLSLSFSSWLTECYQGPFLVHLEWWFSLQVFSGHIVYVLSFSVSSLPLIIALNHCFLCYCLYIFMLYPWSLLSLHMLLSGHRGSTARQAHADPLVLNLHSGGGWLWFGSASAYPGPCGQNFSLSCSGLHSIFLLICVIRSASNTVY